MNFVVRSIIIFFSLFITVIPSFCQTDFEEVLGEEKYNALKELVGLFNNEIARHVKQGFDTTAVIKSFIQLAEAEAPRYSNNLLTIDSLKTIELLKSFKKSKLQDDIWLNLNNKYSDNSVIKYYKKVQDSLSNYEKYKVGVDLYETLDFDYDSLFGETEKIIEFDTTRRMSRYSGMVKALYMCCSDNSFIKEYCETKIMAEYPSSYILAYDFLENSDKIDLNNFYIKSIIVMEFYYHFLFNYVYNKGAPIQP